jgi:hypothetical protein
MKRIIGMSVAGLLVLVQLAGFAALRVEPATYLAPVDGNAATHAHQA